MKGDAVGLDPGGEVRVIGDDEWYLGFELPRAPAPEEVHKTVVVAGDQDSHTFRGVRIRDAPVHTVLAGQRCESASELVALEAEALAFDLQTHEKGSAGFALAHVLVGGEDVAVVHRDERGNRRNEALLIGTGDEETEVVAHGRILLATGGRGSG